MAMRRLVVPLSVVSILAVAVGVADTDKDRWAAYMAAMDKHFRLWEYARKIQPARRDAPLRQLNISDEEVREIQSVAAEVVPRTIVNIGGVVTGCPCEDGSDCTDQVWIVAWRPEKSTGLMLSRINNRWVIGPIQQWWLRYDDLEARRRTFRSMEAFYQAENDLIDRFPACEKPLPIPEEMLPKSVQPSSN